MYSQYVNNTEKQEQELSRLRKNNKEFAAFCDRLKAKSHGLDLDSYLIKPVQRVCKYPLLFRVCITTLSSSL